MQDIDELRQMLQGALVIAGIKIGERLPDTAHEARERIITHILPVIEDYTKEQQKNLYQRVLEEVIGSDLIPADRVTGSPEEAKNELKATQRTALERIFNE